MKPITTDLLEVEVIRAQEWYRKHCKHVDVLMASTNQSYPPSGSDCLHPELWKKANWKWFKEQSYV